MIGRPLRQVFRTAFMSGVAAFVTAACSSPTSAQECSSDATELPGFVCLDIASASLDAHRSTIEAEVVRTLSAVMPRLDVTDLRIVVADSPAAVIPEIGLGGYAPSGDEVRIWTDPSLPDVAGIIERELLPILAHEIHHAMRWRTVGYGSTLFEAAVTEGLADHFSLEVGRATVPPWSTALSPEELDTWLPEVVAGTSGPYDHPTWFLGAAASPPRWTGYAVGYALVQSYLDANPGTTASGLVDEPASSFLP